MPTPFEIIGALRCIRGGMCGEHRGLT